MTNDELRLEALRMANAYAPTLSGQAEVLTRADAYYKFLSGQPSVAPKKKAKRS